MSSLLTLEEKRSTGLGLVHTAGSSSADFLFAAARPPTRRALPTPPCGVEFLKRTSHPLPVLARANPDSRLGLAYLERNTAWGVCGSVSLLLTLERKGSKLRFFVVEQDQLEVGQVLFQPLCLQQAERSQGPSSVSNSWKPHHPCRRLMNL